MLDERFCSLTIRLCPAVYTRQLEILGQAEVFENVSCGELELENMTGLMAGVAGPGCM